MARPSKPVNVIELEKKSHRTKAELQQRRRAEAELLTGKIITETEEVKSNQLAHKEFLRVRKLLRAIGKDDDLYSGVINRYCLISAECMEFEQKRKNIIRQQETLKEHSKNMEYEDYIEKSIELDKTLISYDRQIQAKRKMLFDIEKENVMTIASALRSIPKKPETKKSALLEALNG